MSLTLYTISGAPSPWRVAIGMAIKGIKYETKLMSLATNDHKAPSYLKINPRGTVPTLVNDGIVLRDSIAMLAWLDRTFPDPPLFGVSDTETAAIWQSTMETLDYLPDATSGVLSSIFFQGATEATENLKEAAKVLGKELWRLEATLDASGFLSGANPGAADAVAFPHVRLVQRATETKPEIMTALGLPSLHADFPNLADWITRMEALPGVVDTFPPHWTSAD
ncbi:glutathione S-transferase family protein [Sulfitobacter sp. JB4-11]|uniref:glutathione S-transferase family protein n=1 Tax=Sulfitobacter rhodophyticola TaxID=3238304 RepID=UPI003510F205